MAKRGIADIGILPAALLVAFAVVGWAQGQRRAEIPRTFEGALRAISSASDNACGDVGTELTDFENSIIFEADRAVTQSLNAKPGAAASGATPIQRATQALEELEHASAEINKGWPEESRFHFQVLDVPPAVLVKMTIRDHAAFSFFAVPERGSNYAITNLWRVFGALDDHRSKRTDVHEWLELFVLERGPSNRARFLAKFGYAGCSGNGGGVAYYGYEWNPQGAGELSEVIKLEGAVSTEVEPFAPVGKLQTKGLRITLPFCWYSGIDTFNNPSLCEVDTYDLSDDRVRFVGSVYNRPDLLPVAKAIQYAEARDYPAVQAYCGSAAAALQVMGGIPPFVFGSEGLNVKRIGASKESVEIRGFQEAYHFEVEKRGDRWLVVSFRVE